MAEALGHRWGQIIGDLFEHFVRDLLKSVAEKHELYLDYKKPRRARAKLGGKDLSKVTWQDGYGNRHDLDYVLERGGTENAFGVPIAFIESAWRRYTKHSKNKVQEIEAAVLPIALTFSRHQPFCGAVLAGEFTRTALSQLESKGFSILHIPYASIIEAFQEVGIDASSVDGITTEKEFRRKIEQWERLPQPATIERFLKGCIGFTRRKSRSSRRDLKLHCSEASSRSGSPFCAVTPSSVQTSRARLLTLSRRSEVLGSARTRRRERCSRFKSDSTTVRRSTPRFRCERKPSLFSEHSKKRDRICAQSLNRTI